MKRAITLSLLTIVSMSLSANEWDFVDNPVEVKKEIPVKPVQKTETKKVEKQTEKNKADKEAESKRLNEEVEEAQQELQKALDSFKNRNNPSEDNNVHIRKPDYSYIEQKEAERAGMTVEEHKEFKKKQKAEKEERLAFEKEMGVGKCFKKATDIKMPQYQTWIVTADGYNGFYNSVIEKDMSRKYNKITAKFTNYDMQNRNGQENFINYNECGNGYESDKLIQNVTIDCEGNTLKNFDSGDTLNWTIKNCNLDNVYIKLMPKNSEKNDVLLTLENVKGEVEIRYPLRSTYRVKVLNSDAKIKVSGGYALEMEYSKIKTEMGYEGMITEVTSKYSTLQQIGEHHFPVRVIKAINSKVIGNGDNFAEKCLTNNTNFKGFKKACKSGK